MKRTGFFVGFLALLLLPWFVQAQTPALRVIIMDPTGTHAASVTSGGNLGTAGTSQVTVETISHITSALHIAGIANTVNVNCTAGCAGAGSHTAVSQTAAPWTIAHISSATHIVGTVTCTNCTGGTSDAINVFHQSTIRHISSVTHIQSVGRLGVDAHQGGSWTVTANAGTGTFDVNCLSGCSSSSHTAVTQAAQPWTVAHISSVLHVNIRALPRDAHVGAAQSGIWNVTAHQGGTGYTIQHISSAVHVAGIVQVNCVTGCSAGTAHTAVTQAGQWTTAHVTSVTHVVGSLMLKSQAGTTVTVTGTALDVNCTGCAAASVVNVGHISSALHVAAIASHVTVKLYGPATYVWQTPDAVGGASKLHADMFNASGSGKIIRIIGIYPTIKTDVAVTGVLAIRFDLYRTSAVGTGGTAAAYKSATLDVAGGNITPRDTANAALPAQITARHLPTGGATISEWISREGCFTEETNAGTHLCHGQTEVLYGTGGAIGQQFLTLREGQGLLIKQGAVASVNNIAFGIVFVVEER